MSHTGISRPVDALGRIVIPAELRRALGIAEGDRLSLSLDGERIVLEKHGGDALEDLCRACERLLASGSLTAENAGRVGRLARDLAALCDGSQVDEN